MTAVGPDLAPVTLGGRYVLGEVIAYGGSSTITRALDTRMGCQVAVKQPLDRRNGDAAARVEHEAAMLARCAHPGVVACYDLGIEGGAPYLVMQYVEGMNLAQLLATDRPIPASTAITCAIWLCRSLAHVHARGVVHGDVKPQHVLVGQSGAITLVDFDRARLERTHAIDGAHEQATGTAAYSAPEVRAGEPSTARSDVYSLGVVLRRLFARACGGQRDANALTLTARLAAITEPLLAADPADRPAHAGVVTAALAEARASMP